MFDTADGYGGGESEEIFGTALHSRRKQVIIATKVGFPNPAAPRRGGLSRDHILWSVDQSLKRLGTDYIDLYIAHKEDRSTPLEETLQAFDSIVRAGKVRYLGFSNWSAWTAAAALEIQKAQGLAPFTHGQMYYSLLGRDVEWDILPMMARYGLSLTVWSPLAFGFLSGKYKRDAVNNPANRLTVADFLPFDKARGFAVVDLLQPIAAHHGCSVAQVAIAWLLAKQSVTAIILGASKLHQIEDNLRAVDVTLTPDEVAKLDAATALPLKYPDWQHDRY
jgi:aryl-alcohol dehydrogenase-like predicted oxidoreductase